MKNLVEKTIDNKEVSENGQSAEGLGGILNYSRYLLENREVFKVYGGTTKLFCVYFDYMPIFLLILLLWEV